MRLGAPLLDAYETPEEWVDLLAAEGYSAALCPVGLDHEPADVERYAEAAEEAGIVVAEVGAWSNPLSADPDEAARSLAYCQKALALADRIGARCCVNIAGSPGPVWGGPAAANFSPRTFNRIVKSVQAIIDVVRPQRTFFTLEVMPWIAPDSAESYLQLLEAVDRERFAVHFDAANLINDPRKYYNTGELITDFLRKLGPLVKSCHAKDIVIDADCPPWTLRLFECRPGDGNLDWDTLLTELARLDPDLPLLLEHLDSAEDYRAASRHIREAALRNNVELVPAAVKR